MPHSWNIPTRSTSHCSDQGHSSCSAHMAGSSVVPIWHRKPERFLESCWSLLQNGSPVVLALTSAQESAAVTATGQINSQARAETKQGNGNFPLPEPFVWTATRRCHHHRWVFPYISLGSMDSSSVEGPSSVFLICGKLTRKSSIIQPDVFQTSLNPENLIKMHKLMDINE